MLSVKRNGESMQNLLKQIRKADDDFKLIEDNDCIALGLSGGKDSMLLLQALSIYQKFNHKKFSLIAIHMDMGFSKHVDSTLQNYCDSLHIPLHIEPIPIFEILKNYPKKDGSIDCSRCSNLKRGGIVSLAKKYNANKIAFAHHNDDAIETLFLNMIYGGKVNSFHPKINYEEQSIGFIRPMIYAKEKQIIRLVKQLNIPVVLSKCPKDGHSKRNDIKEHLDIIYKLYPSAKQNFSSILFDENANLWKKN